MEKFKGHDIVDNYPEDGWLKGYFYAIEEDLKNGKAYGAYQDLEYIRSKDNVLNLLNIKKNERILDVGCADGAMMIYCGLLGAEVYGIDISVKNVEKANQYLQKYGLRGKAVVSDAKNVSFPENHFDKIVSSDFFEHLNCKDNICVFKEVKRVLKPNGIFIIKTPNLTYLKLSRFCKMIWQITRFKNPFDIVIPHTVGENPGHLGLVSRKKMVKIVKSAGFLNFTFYYDINSKVEKFNYFLSEFFAETPILRDLFAEHLIVVIYKPTILSLFR